MNDTSIRIVMAVLLWSLSAAAAEKPCNVDVDCPGDEVCDKGACVLHPAAQPPAPTVAAEPETPGHMRVGVEAAADFFPSSSQTVPDSSQGEMGFFGRLRILVGHTLGARSSLAGLAEFGYAAAGREPGHGQDGLMSGVGAEYDFAANDSMELLARLTANFLLVKLSGGTSSGTIAGSALFLSGGARFFHVIDVHLDLGNDYAGGTSLGLGIGIGYF